MSDRNEWDASGEGRLVGEVRRNSALGSKKAQVAIRSGKVSVDGQVVLEPGTPVAAGARVRLDMAAPNPAKTAPLGLRLVHRDADLLVVEKPSGLLSSPLPNSDEPSALHGARVLCRGGTMPKVVHRLDKETSGLLVFARNAATARALREIIDSRKVRRTYHCVVAGIPSPPEATLSSMLLRDRGDGRRGSRRGTLKARPLRAPDPGPMPGKGKHAITRFRVVEAVTRNPQIPEDEGRAALEVWLSTGRTHQIRIHLAEHGCPVLGERVYARQDGAPRQALHAARLSFDHPRTGETLTFHAPWPADLAEVRPTGEGW